MRYLIVLVMAFLFGSSFVQAEEQTLTSLTQKAKAGDTSAQYGLALEYMFGKQFSRQGIEQKPRYYEAAKWLQKAAEAGHPKSQYLLGTLYERGRGVKQDSDLAVAWYKKAVAGGNMDAACPLARLYEKSDIHPKDPEITRPCYMK